MHLDKLGNYSGRIASRRPLRRLQRGDDALNFQLAIRLVSHITPLNNAGSCEHVRSVFGCFGHLSRSAGLLLPLK